MGTPHKLFFLRLLPVAGVLPQQLVTHRLFRSKKLLLQQ
jgi:hypothetical protein